MLRVVYCSRSFSAGTVTFVEALTLPAKAGFIDMGVSEKSFLCASGDGKGTVIDMGVSEKPCCPSRIAGFRLSLFIASAMACSYRAAGAARCCMLRSMAAAAEGSMLWSKGST